MTPDAAYRNLFSHREVMADLLSGYAAADWVDELDLSTLEPANTVFIADELRERRSDIIWRVRWNKSDWLYVFVLLEFQRTVDRHMALRMLAYVALLYQDLIKAGQLADGRVPPVLPIVLYNGESPWHAPVSVRHCIHPGPAALQRHLPELDYVFLDENRMKASGDPDERNLASAIFRLEQSRSGRDIKNAVDAIGDWLSSPRQSHLARAFSEWIGKVLLPARLPEAPAPGTMSLDGIRSMLADKVERWVKEWKEAGLEEGRREGRALGLEEGHAEGRAEGRAEGHAEGRAEGHAEGQAKGLILGRAQALLDLARAGTISVQQAKSAIDAIIAESPGLTAELQSLKDSLQGH